MSQPEPVLQTHFTRRQRRRWWWLTWRLRWLRVPRLIRLPIVITVWLVLLAGLPFGWTQAAAFGHAYDEADMGVAGAPTADVVLVLGAQVAPGGNRPMPFLRGRLETAAALVRDGRAKVILVSGDGDGGSGDETAVMSTYLIQDLGVDPRRLVVDSDGRDTYDSCWRARRVYGVTRALVVTQPYHLARAVALCRHVGIDAEGVGARCPECSRFTLLRNAVRDYFACSKAALDAVRERPPAVLSPPSPAISDALAGLGS